MFRIKQLTLKLVNQEQKLTRHGTPSPSAVEKINRLHEFQDELENLRKQTVDKEIKVKRWSVYVKDAMPEGYDF